MSIPTWSYDSGFYEEKTRGTHVYIKTDPIKGKGLFARHALTNGSIALEETAMCCTQNRDDYLKNIPVCGNCLRSVETPRGTLSRVSKNKSLALELPHAAAYRANSVVRCRFMEQGCPMMFCSTRCQEAAWTTFHYVNCRGCMTEDQQAAHDQFVTNDWEQGGVDYSDTHFLAMRFLSGALTRRRLHKTTLDDSYAHIGQLIKAPITKFYFGFLLRDDEAVEGLALDVKEKVLWDEFQLFKGHEADHPRIKTAIDAGCSKEEMLRSGSELIAKSFSMTEEEQVFYLGDRWSHLLGAVLLNGQERTPHSPYYEHMEAMSSIAFLKPDITAFNKKLKAMGVHTQKLHTSSSGQGIYTIGCLFNHSCDPNLQVLYADANDETLVAVCMRDIEEGEELCISYINEALPFAERQQQLYEHYLFDCTCRKCSNEKNEAIARIAAIVVPPTVQDVDHDAVAIDSSHMAPSTVEGEQCNVAIEAPAQSPTRDIAQDDASTSTVDNDSTT